MLLLDGLHQLTLEQTCFMSAAKPPCLVWIRFSSLCISIFWFSFWKAFYDIVLKNWMVWAGTLFGCLCTPSNLFVFFQTFFLRVFKQTENFTVVLDFKPQLRWLTGELPHALQRRSNCKTPSGVAACAVWASHPIALPLSLSCVLESRKLSSFCSSIG